LGGFAISLYRRNRREKTIFFAGGQNSLVCSGRAKALPPTKEQSLSSYIFKRRKRESNGG
jgi:hypothetical protein